MNPSAHRRPILTVGLTGGIASGKSTVDAMFEALGARVIDADEVVHSLLGPGGKATAPVLAAFGPAVAGRDGGVDRAALGGIVFRNPRERARLEVIVHPLVTEAIALRLEEIRERDTAAIVIVDAALLVETGLDRQFDRLVVVTCSEQSQVERLADSRGLDRDEALRRVHAQAPAAEKAAHAHYTIDNDGSLDRTRDQVEEVYRSLARDYALKAERDSAGERPLPLG